MKKENWKVLEQTRIDEIYFLLKNLSPKELSNLPHVIKHIERKKPEKKEKDTNATQTLFDRLKKE